MGTATETQPQQLQQREVSKPNATLWAQQIVIPPDVKRATTRAIDAEKAAAQGGRRDDR